jgi:hypothetical protein
VGRYYCPHQKTPNAQNSKNGKIPRPKKKNKQAEFLFVAKMAVIQK